MVAACTDRSRVIVLQVGWGLGIGVVTGFTVYPRWHERYGEARSNRQLRNLYGAAVNEARWKSLTFSIVQEDGVRNACDPRSMICQMFASLWIAAFCMSPPLCHSLPSQKSKRWAVGTAAILKFIFIPLKMCAAKEQPRKKKDDIHKKCQISKKQKSGPLPTKRTLPNLVRIGGQGALRTARSFWVANSAFGAAAALSWESCAWLGWHFLTGNSSNSPAVLRPNLNDTCKMCKMHI